MVLVIWWCGTRPRMEPIRDFFNWAEAFDFCREVDKPVTVMILEDNKEIVYKLFPSGRAEFIKETWQTEAGSERKAMADKRRELVRFKLRDAYKLGVELRESVAAEMLAGHPISCPEDMGLLAQMIYNSNGGHLEIGTATGGSAFVALKVMEHYGRSRKVVCIDPFATRTVHVDAQNGFWRNAKHLGVEDRIEMISARSHPFPVEKGRRFATALIDGDHSYECVKNDWRNTKDVVDQYIMFHDYTKPPVRKVVINAAQDEDWILVAIHGWSAVLCKLNPKN